MKNKILLFRVLTSVAALYHLFLGVSALLFPPDVLSGVFGFVMGVGLEFEGDLLLASKFAGSYVLVFGLGLALLAWKPVEHRILLPGVLLLFGIRLLNRILLFSTPTDRKMILLEYLLIFATWSALILLIPIQSLLIHWVYPLVVFNVLTNLRGVASHAMCDVEDIYLSSRTITCSRLMEGLFLHENYHLEHHLYPRVPSYHLRELHRLIHDRLPRALEAESYPDFLRMFFHAARRLDLNPSGVRVRDPS